MTTIFSSKLIKITIVGVILTMLTACVPAIFVLGAAAGGAAVYDRRNMRTMFEDQNISQQALDRINGNAALKQKAHIVLTTFDHIVLIVGQTPTPELRAKAVSIVKSVPNVRRIYNEITVGPLTSPMIRSNDAWITTKAKGEMLITEGLHSSQIKVTTENSVVYLMGIVTHKQADLAVKAVRKISGVQRVVKLFEYANY